MKNALILHGTNATSKDHWFAWLKERLVSNGFDVWVPDLPRADKPKIERYNKFLLSNNNFTYNSKTIIIGHSSGAVAILGLLAELPTGTSVHSVYLVASFKDDLGWDSLTELFAKKFDFDDIKKKSQKFIFIHSDNDPYCPIEGAEYLCDNVGGRLIVIKNQGHFNLEVGPQYRQFPELLEIIKKETPDL